MSRYFTRDEIINNDEQYEDLMDDRGVLEINQYATPKLKIIEKEQLNLIQCYRYTWKHGDMFWKISARYYGEPKHWWIIATFNRKPTEFHVKPGEVIKIPISLSDAIQAVQ